ncbi:hypothetical protein [Roseivirga echinicomitans]|uniref:Outer membrane protein beta-barrel domain-containing protein n=1 Tax=Roseivirga echinicomitans TaxID=296218 RepID=A0A150XNF3_9BACT|nr:hypothetical protein [Roseivirga echinicomitans]KYG80221.1 hypothetical protein AWN68_17110 [Roseivirga echinicomitans]
MKIIIIFILSFICLEVSSQSLKKQEVTPKYNLEVSPSANRTVYGWKYGIRMGVDYKSRLKLGYTRLESFDNSEKGQKTFAGTYFQYAINPNAKFTVLPSLKIGLFDGKFLAVQPTIEGAYAIRDGLSFNLGLGRSDGFMSFDLGLKWSLKLD